MNEGQGGNLVCYAVGAYGVVYGYQHFIDEFVVGAALSFL